MLSMIAYNNTSTKRIEIYNMNLLSMRKPCQIFGLFALTIALNGCVVKNISQTMAYTVKGDYYLQNENFEKGRLSFQSDVQKNPSSVVANYYYGRFLLYDKDYKEALTFLAKARDL